MLAVQFIRENREKVLRSLTIRSFEPLNILDDILAADDLRRSLQQDLDAQRAELKSISSQIGQLMRKGEKAAAEEAKSQTAGIKSRIHELEQLSRDNAERLEELLLQVPNCAHETVPAGKCDLDNVVEREWKKDLPELPKEAKPHWELAQEYNLIDFETGAKITGAGFPLYTGMGAKLQRALINFFLDEADKAGYREFLPPHLVNEASARGTGQLPDKDGQMYHATADNLYLIPTAEVPLTNIYRDVILAEDDFPICLTGYTPCFRREAGSYGAHVRGLNRLHQFDKVEIVRLEHPDRSYQALEEMCAHVEGLLAKLELPFRTLRLCGGDLGFAAALTIDFETYSAAQDRWLEVSSVSNFEEFQANRLKLRYRPNEGKGTIQAHTLNGSALALPRILATILENNQCEEGIRIPKALQGYLGGRTMITK
ncbi:serine--tRNA ligase [Saprospira grandis]|uniref:Serine--tRNA ligase n=1 Tax=Saprospira grandis (strain Lewin) TaxID=984262 RepID=H6LAA7_SAPGL|nr:serine--tRNA ligase [Saprospira grandis]AFC24392.1 seryl-tRNA synthetase [Saprospira grandis str. Lewin]